MSRVDDDRNAERVTQRLLQEKQKAEAKTKQQREGENAFSRLVQSGQTAKAQTQQKQETKQSIAQQVFARVMKEGQGTSTRQQEGTQTRQTSQRQDAGQARGRQEAKNISEHVEAGLAGEAEKMSEGQAADAAHGELMAADRAESREGTESLAESRTSDSKAEGDAKADDKASDMRAAGRAGQKGALKTDADSGGGGQGSGNKDGKQGGDAAAAAAGFRFNPALMAPVPVAKPKPNAGSDRLRALANEIAQKIVERVRVGTNGAGAAEFQIDLRSNILSGLSIKLSAKNGKIQAVFSGSDKDVLKMIEEQSEGLKTALQGRGLKLEALRFEARA